MRITPYISAGRDLWKHWIHIVGHPQSLGGYHYGFYGGGSEVRVIEGELELSTDRVYDAYAYLIHNVLFCPQMTWDKERRLNVFVGTSYLQHHDVWIGSGILGEGENFIGFYITEGDVYGLSIKEGISSDLVYLTHIEDETSNLFSLTFIPHTKVIFHINGIYQGEITENLPEGSYCAQSLLECDLYNLENIFGLIYIFTYDFIQRK